METRGQTIFDEIQLFSPNKYCVSPTRLIQASRINQALCDEAEAGRAHGDCILDERCLILAGEQVKIHLDRGVHWGLGKRYCKEPFDYFSGGEPQIEAMTPNGPIPINNDEMWMTQFPHLRASVCSRLKGSTPDMFGVHDVEYQQAAALGEKWGLTGHWGSPNRLDHESSWHADDSLLTTDGDSAGSHYLAHAANGHPQYAMEWISSPFGNILLPYHYLKRSGYWGPRRVFFPPEKDIAIWYREQINKKINKIIITARPEQLLYSNCPFDTIVGCLPGGTPSIGETDISTLRGRECWIPFNENDLPSYIEFVVRVAARLRREYQTPHLVRLENEHYGNNPHPVEIGLSDLCKLAGQCNLFVPEELRVEYLGDLTERISRQEFKPVIQGVLNAGECMKVHVSGLPAMLLASHIAAHLHPGRNIFDDLWPVSTAHSAMILADRGSETVLSHYRPTSAVRLADCRFIDAEPEKRMRWLQELVRSVDVVLVTAEELLEEHPDLCIAIIRYCISHEKAVILFPKSPLAPKIQRQIARSFTASSIGVKDGLGAQITDSLGTDSVTVTFSNGTLIHAERSLHADTNLALCDFAPSPLPDFSKSKRLAELAEAGQ